MEQKKSKRMNWKPFTFENKKHKLFITPSNIFSWKVERHDYLSPSKNMFTVHHERYFYPYNAIGFAKAVKYFNKRKKELILA